MSNPTTTSADAHPHAALAALLRPSLFAPLLAAAGLLVSAWFLPYRLLPSDEGAVLTQASRILDGAVYYRDIDAYPLPGASYLLAGVMAIFGEHVTVARGLAGVVYTGILLAIYWLGLQILGPRRAALLAISLLSFKFIAWPSLTAYFYWDLSFCFACLGIAAMLGHGYRGPSFRLVSSGLFAGLAFVSKQTVGLYLGLACAGLLLFPGRLLGREREAGTNRWRELGFYALGFALPVSCLLLYFAVQGLIGQLFESAFLRPFTGYLPNSALPFSIPLRWWELGSLRGGDAAPYFVQPYLSLLQNKQLPSAALVPAYWLAGELFTRLLYSSVPLAFLGVFLLRVREVRSAHRTLPQALLAHAYMTFAVFLSAFPRADFPHVISVYPLILVLLFGLWGLADEHGWRRNWRAAVFRSEALIALAVVIVSFSLAARQHAHLTYPLRLARANLRVAPNAASVESVVRYVEQEVRPDDSILVYVHEAYYYFLTDRFYPWPFVQLYPGMAGGDGGAALTEQLRRQPPELVIRGNLSIEGVPRPIDYAPQLESYLRRNFVLDREFLRRSPPATRRFPVRILRPARESGNAE